MRGEALARLRAETREEHERLEARVDLPSRLTDRGAYGSLLARFFGFYAAHEPALLAAVPVELGLDLSRRRHLPKLRADLVALDIAAPPPTADLTVGEDPAEAVGALYVIEGSTLGGQVVTRALQDALGILPDGGGAFFAGYGEENGAMWRGFCEAVERYAEAAGDVEKMVQGARKTFVAMEAWLV